MEDRGGQKSAPSLKGLGRWVEGLWRDGSRSERDVVVGEDVAGLVRGAEAGEGVDVAQEAAGYLLGCDVLQTSVFVLQGARPLRELP